MGRIVTAKNANRHNGRRLAFQVLYGLGFANGVSRADLVRVYRQALDVNDSEADDADDAFGQESASQARNGADGKNTAIPGSGKSSGRSSGKAVDAGPGLAADWQPEGFAWELVCGVCDNQARLDAEISRLAKNWRLERLGRIETIVLRLAVYELFFRPDVPPRVAISEALDLAGQFGADSAKSFINGILDAAARTRDKGKQA